MYFVFYKLVEPDLQKRPKINYKYNFFFVFYYVNQKGMQVKYLKNTNEAF